jgi:hypothetical protein
MLGAVVGGAAAAVAAALPAGVAAHDADDVRLGGDNTTATRTRITSTVSGGTTGDNAAIAGVDLAGGAIGVYGLGDGFGLFGNGTVGVLGNGAYGVTGLGSTQGVLGHGLTPTSQGVVGFTGSNDIPSLPTSVGVLAVAATASQTALQVMGRVRFDRGGRVSIGANARSKTFTKAGVTTSSYVLATLQTHVTGLYIAAVVPGSGRFTVYLSKAPGKKVYLGYLVIN